ncbi:hypothetical protein ACFQZ4_42135 [Catellatospora coxensis]
MRAAERRRGVAYLGFWGAGAVLGRALSRFQLSTGIGMALAPAVLTGCSPPVPAPCGQRWPRRHCWPRARW